MAMKKSTGPMGFGKPKAGNGGTIGAVGDKSSPAANHITATKPGKSGMNAKPMKPKGAC